mmetsp:Transcript_29261/g.93797  ORF Transcript_29261/g.93797 Transcript_29261/m.93797 type:complete len:206 (-) Transcript_29261:160-777(-)
MAMLLMSSMMTTVLPTPAPPKRPILPPLAYGARRSTTLMPVTRISADLPCSVKVGALAWIGANLSVGTGPRSSTGSPMMFMIRPRAAGPTGTMIGLPVSSHSWPRTRPSVASMAMVRTVFSPRCCATSSTRRGSSLATFTSRALRMGGSSPSNCTSTTAPMTCVTLPVAPSTTGAAWNERAADGAAARRSAAFAKRIMVDTGVQS